MVCKGKSLVRKVWLGNDIYMICSHCFSYKFNRKKKHWFFFSYPKPAIATQNNCLAGNSEKMIKEKTYPTPLYFLTRLRKLASTKLWALNTKIYRWKAPHLGMKFFMKNKIVCFIFFYLFFLSSVSISSFLEQTE